MSLIHQMEVRLNAGDLSLIDCAAARAGLSRSEFVRRAAEVRSEQILSWTVDLDEWSERDAAMIDAAANRAGLTRSEFVSLAATTQLPETADGLAQVDKCLETGSAAAGGK